MIGFRNYYLIAVPVGILVAAAMLVLARPAAAGPPFLTDDPVPVDYQHWEIYGFSQGTHKQGDTSGTLPGVEINYGAAPNLQLHLIAPVGAFDKPGGSAGTKFGYGDTELGVKYRFIEESKDGWWPQVGVFPLFEAPTGNLQRGLGTGRVHEFLPVWLQKDFDPWVTYGGGGYWINPGPGNQNYWFAGWEATCPRRRGLSPDRRQDRWQGQHGIQPRWHLRFYRQLSSPVLSGSGSPKRHGDEPILVLPSLATDILSGPAL